MLRNFCSPIVSMFSRRRLFGEWVDAGVLIRSNLAGVSANISPTIR